MQKMNGGNSVFSSGPKITQAIPVAQRTPFVPTEYGIPTMAKDSFATMDPRMSDVPEFTANDADYGDASDTPGTLANKLKISGAKTRDERLAIGAEHGKSVREQRNKDDRTIAKEKWNNHPKSASDKTSEDAVSPEKVQSEVRGPNEGGQFSAHARHDKDRAMRGGFPDAKTAHKWSSTMKRKIAKQSLQSDEVPDDMDMSMSEDRHIPEAPKTDINKWAKGSRHPDNPANFEQHLGAIQEASKEKRPMSIKPGVIGRAKTYREENLPKE